MSWPQSLVRALLAAVFVAAPATAQRPGPCAGERGFDVTVRGFRTPTGYIKVYLYGDDPDAFLQHARWLQRIEIPVRSMAPIRLCLPIADAGRYAISVRHDVNGDRRRIDSSDGGGFSNNPRLSLLNLQPALSRVLVPAGEEASSVDIVLNYRFGLQIRPV